MDEAEDGAGAGPADPSLGGTDPASRPDASNAAAAPPTLVKPAANDGADLDGATRQTQVDGAAQAPPVESRNSTPIDDTATRAVSTKLLWAEALRRAFGWDLLKCPHCGGRRKMLAAIRNLVQVEKILRHIGQWREPGDNGNDDVVAIRGPPGSFDDVDETPGDALDGVDDPVEQDWAA